MEWVSTMLEISLLAICSIQDLKKKKIKMAYPLLWGTAGLVINLKTEEAAACLAGSLPGIFLMVLSVATRGSVGLGDGLLVAATGVILGLRESVWILLGALLLATVLGLGMMAVGKWHRKDAVPFVPFLLAAHLGVIIWQII